MNIMQTAASLCDYEKRKNITCNDIKWVIKSGRYSRIIKNKIFEEEHSGVINGLAVMADGTGMIIKIEAVAKNGNGKISVSGNS